MIPILENDDDDDNENTIIYIYNYSLVQQIIALLVFSLYLFFSILLIFNNFNLENTIIKLFTFGISFCFYVSYIYLIIKRYQIYRDNLTQLPIVINNNVTVAKDTHCLICLNIFDDKIATKLDCTCKYYYHKECINEWLNIKNICPICKYSLYINND